MDAKQLNDISGRIVDSAVAVHRRYGPGLLESAYKPCLAWEMEKRGLRFVQEYPLPLVYEGVRIDCAYRLDFLVEGGVIIEVKAVEQLAPIHTAQMLTYLRVSGRHLGLILNFGSEVMRVGIRRVVNRFPELGAIAVEAHAPNENAAAQSVAGEIAKDE